MEMETRMQQERKAFDPTSKMEEVTESGLFVKLNIIDEATDVNTIRQALYEYDIELKTKDGMKVIGPFDHEENAYVIKKCVLEAGYECNVTRF